MTKYRKENWVAKFDVPTALIPGHIVYESRSPHTPVASVWCGGTSEGRKIQRRRTLLIASAPKMLRTLEAVTEQLEAVMRLSNSSHDAKALLTAKALIKKLRKEN